MSSFAQLRITLTTTDSMTTREKNSENMMIKSNDRQAQDYVF